MVQDVFQRIEKKYMLTQAQYRELQEAFIGRLRQDQYGLHTIANLYFDTEDYALIRASIEKPVYKEKLRLRSYGTPKAGDRVFLELKKKFKGIVYKRRAPLELLEARAWLEKGLPARHDSQILREIDWFRSMHSTLAPRVFLAYDRVAMVGIEDDALRITWDDNIRWRTAQLDLSKGSWGAPLLAEGQVLMEIKLPGAMPLWLSHALSDLSIVPTSFSKYGCCYTNHLIHDLHTTGGIAHVS